MNAPMPHPVDDDSLDLGDLPGSVGFMLRLAQIRSFSHFFRAFADTDVKPGEFTVIWVIGLNPGIRQGTLARALHIKPAHMTKLIQRMVAEGRVRRTIPPEDRRSVRLALTAAGEAYLAKYRKNFLSVHAAEKVGLNDAELSQLLTLLTKLSFPEGAQCP